MAIWQILSPAGLPVGENYDDGAPEQPGEAGFSTTIVQTYVATLGIGAAFNYVGASPSIAGEVQ